MKIGYARVSTDTQDTALQEDALQAAGCSKIFRDTFSGSVPAAQRPQLQAAREYMRPSDTLVVWRLDRLGRSLQDLIRQVTALEEDGMNLASLHEAIDTGTAAGILMYHVFGALAEFECNVIRERTKAGLAAARAVASANWTEPSCNGRHS